MPPKKSKIYISATHGVALADLIDEEADAEEVEAMSARIHKARITSSLEKVLDTYTSLSPSGLNAVARVIVVLGEENILTLSRVAPPNVAAFLRSLGEEPSTEDDIDPPLSPPPAKASRLDRIEQIMTDMATVVRQTAATQREHSQLFAGIQRAALQQPWSTDLTSWHRAHEAGAVGPLLDAAEAELRRARYPFAMTGRALVDAARAVAHTADWPHVRPLVVEILVHDAIVTFMATRPTLPATFYERAKPHLRAAGDGLWTGLAASAARVADVLAVPAAKERTEDEDRGGGRRGTGPRREPVPHKRHGGWARYAQTKSRSKPERDVKEKKSDAPSSS